MNDYDVLEEIITDKKFNRYLYISGILFKIKNNGVCLDSYYRLSDCKDYIVIGNSKENPKLLKNISGKLDKKHGKKEVA